MGQDDHLEREGRDLSTVRTAQGFVVGAQELVDTAVPVDPSAFWGRYSNLNLAALIDTCSRIVVASAGDASVWVMASSRTSVSVTV